MGPARGQPTTRASTPAASTPAASILAARLPGLGLVLVRPPKLTRRRGSAARRAERLGRGKTAWRRIHLRASASQAARATIAQTALGPGDRIPYGGRHRPGAQGTRPVIGARLRGAPRASQRGCLFRRGAPRAS
jgi:hypothetical protein